MSSLPRLIDLSHTVEHGLVTYKGIPAPVISEFMTRDTSQAHYEQGTTFHIGKIEMVANTGTYIDSPFHRYADGKDLSELDLASLANLDGIVFHAPPGVRPIGRELFRDADLDGKAVVVHTGWDRHWETEQYFEGHPFLTSEAAVHLRDAGATLVGADSYNIDDTTDGTRPAHPFSSVPGFPLWSTCAT